MINTTNNSVFFKCFYFKRVRTVPYFRQIAGIIYVCFVYFAAIAQAWINLHRQHVFYQWCCERGAKSHVAKKISGRGRRKSRNEKGNQGFGDFRFINILQLFLFISFFQLLYFIIFSILFLPTTFTHTHDPRPLPLPTTFSYTRENVSVQFIDCSQSPIFSWDRLDIPRLLTVMAILILKFTEGAGVGDYGWGGGGEEGRENFSLPPKPPPPPR